MSMPSPLISAIDLRNRRAQGWQPLLLDCSFDLADTQAGQRAFEAGHVPGALYAHLERDLSGPKSAAGPIEGGRHPLPRRETLAFTMGGWGLTPERDVVVMCNAGSMVAARAWWLLRWMGHRAVQVLDGGPAAWVAAGGPLQAGPAEPPQACAAYPTQAPAMPTRHADELLAQRGQLLVLDARAPERYRGEVEPLDSQAGHIPGARNRFFKTNLQADGRFRPAEELRAELLATGWPAHNLVHQCGSGVTACHNVLVYALAGLGDTSLYPGSWSEWSADPARPVAKC